MRIGIDVDLLGLPNPYTGIPNYLRHLINGFLNLGPGALRFYLISRRPVYENAGLPTHVRQEVVRWPFSRGWQSVALPWAAMRLRLDLLHLPAFTVPPLAPCPLVVTVHDLAYLTHPECCREETVSYLSRRVPPALKKAAAVFTPSIFVKEEIIRHFALSPAKIHPIPHGVSPEFKVLPAEAVAKTRKELGLPERFFLFVGTIEPRKNVRRLIEAFGRAVAQGLDCFLVLAGAKGWKCEEIYRLPQQLGIERWVLFLGYAPDDLLPALYNAATAFVYPSLYEGFGLPVLEAMACGTPVIASNTSSLPEVVGEAGMLVNPLDTGELASAMLFLVLNPEVKQDLARRGIERAARFSWERTARETLKVYEACIKRTEKGRARNENHLSHR
jgi:glycosyltransferase involved in cell wall biosynthesis